MNEFEKTQQLAEDFIKFFGLGMAKFDCYAQCHNRSRFLAAWLKSQNLDAMELELGEPKLGFDEDCDQRWRESWPYLYHFMVIHNGFCIDLSGPQFGKRYEKTVWTYSEVKDLWNSVKIRSWNANSMESAQRYLIKMQEDRDLLKGVSWMRTS